MRVVTILVIQHLYSLRRKPNADGKVQSPINEVMNIALRSSIIHAVGRELKEQHKLAVKGKEKKGEEEVNVE